VERVDALLAHVLRAILHQLLVRAEDLCVQLPVDSRVRERARPRAE
jgi:hypothetical protein